MTNLTRQETTLEFDNLKPIMFGLRRTIITRDQLGQLKVQAFSVSHREGLYKITEKNITDAEMVRIRNGELADDLGMFTNIDL